MAEPKHKFRRGSLLAGTSASLVLCLVCGCEAMLSSPAIHSPKDYAVVTPVPLPSRPSAQTSMLQQPPRTQAQKKASDRPPEQPSPAPVVVVSNPVAPPVQVAPAPAKPIEHPPSESEKPLRKIEVVPRVDLAAERSALMQRDVTFSDASEKKGPAEAFYEFMSADATLLREGDSPIKGKEAIKVRMAAGQQGSMTWKPEEASVGAHAEMGFTWGTYIFRSQAPERRTSRGQYVTVWEKQGGQWKVVLWSSSTTPTQAPRRSELGTGTQ